MSTKTDEASDYDVFDLTKSGYIDKKIEEHEYPYRSRWILYELYVVQEMTCKEAGERLGCCRKTVSDWLDKTGVEARSVGRPNDSSAGFYHQEGYPAFQSHHREDGEKVSKSVGIHQLVAIAEGADPEKVFSSGECHVHHRNGQKTDHRPENLTLLSNSEHQEIHGNEAWVQERGEWVLHGPRFDTFGKDEPVDNIEGKIQEADTSNEAAELVDVIEGECQEDDMQYTIRVVADD